MKTLAEMKRDVANGREFKILEHYISPEHTGEIRTPNVIQTNGFYSVVKDNPCHPVSMANGNKGYWYGYEKANCYEFDGDKVLFKFKDGEKFMMIEFV